MSRNFELLQRIGREQALYTTSPVPEPEPFAEQPVVFSGPVASQLAITSAELEEFTKLVQRLFIMPGNDSPRSVVFTATERGNGCSWVTARVADVLASQVSGSVCLVDANLRRPGLHEQFPRKIITACPTLCCGPIQFAVSRAIWDVRICG